MAKAKVNRPFLTVSVSTFDAITANQEVTGAHIAAFVTASCFSGRQSTTTSAGNQSLFTYAGISRVRAKKVLADLDKWGLVVESEEILGKWRKTIQHSVEGEQIYIPSDVVLDESKPMAKLATLPGGAGKLFLHSYMTHDQLVEMFCDPALFPHIRYNMEQVAETEQGDLWLTTDASLDGAESVAYIEHDKVQMHLNRLIEAGLLIKSVTVFDGEPKEFAKPLYSLTTPFNKKSSDIVNLGTEAKKYCRSLGHSIKDGAWAVFAPKGTVPVAVGVYAPAFPFHGPDEPAGLRAFRLRQYEAKRLWSSIVRGLKPVAQKAV